MMTVNEVSKLTGVSIRTLQYYDKIGLLHPTKYTESGYRLYDDTALDTLQQILLFRELEFPLKEIREIICSPDFDRDKAVTQQIELLILKREHLDNLILFARGIKMLGAGNMDFKAFDTSKIEEYAERAKEQWGRTSEFKEFEEKAKGRTKEDEQQVMENLMQLFKEFGEIKTLSPDAAEPQIQVKKLQNYITEYYYHCTNEILFGLGEMYSAGGEFTENIDRVGGEGTADFAMKAIGVYCGK